MLQGRNLPGRSLRTHQGSQVSALPFVQQSPSLLLLTMTTTTTSPRPALVAYSPPLISFREASFPHGHGLHQGKPALRLQARQRRKGGGEGALPHRRF